MAIADHVRTVVTPLLTDLGLEIYDIEQVGATLRITVDRPGGIDMDSLALATRVVSRELDHVDPIPGHYTLEVTSPGLERRLRVPEHFQRAVGSEVALRTHPRDGAPRRFSGVLSAADDHGITVTVTTTDAGVSPGDHRVEYADIDKCRTLFHWGAAPKPSPSRQKPRSGSASGKKKSRPVRPGPVPPGTRRHGEE